MVSKMKCGMLTGICGKIVTVQSDISEGLPVFQMIGNLSSEVKESRERVRTALKNTGYFLPVKRISVNIAPSDFKKTGVSFDVAIALSILHAMGLIPERKWDEILIIGELALDGRILPVHGVLPMLYEALKNGIKTCLIPRENLAEGELLEGLEVYGFERLSDIISFLQGKEEAACYELEEKNTTDIERTFSDFSEIKGQEMAKRAAVIMAAGYHNLLLEGTPGVGKSMLASAIIGIMPPLSWKEKMEVLMIHSAGRMLRGQNLTEMTRPYRAPGLGVTQTELIGDGRNRMVGEVTLAHRGVLFLDELTLRKASVLEHLRTPLESHIVTLHNREEVVTFPADFAFVGACNPCPCGYYPDRNKCNCTQAQIHRYWAKISGPIRDRMDLFVHCDTPEFERLTGKEEGKTSQEIREEIQKVWEVQEKRQQGIWNGRLSGRLLETFCALDEECEQFMKNVYHRFDLTGRSYYKVLRVARTIADLRGAEQIDIADLQEALQYRMAPR